jgi:predicted Zn finger-like uncharacterized protein
VYTQCAKCDTVFKLSADVLRTAGGQVRCGRCGEVFNALARLSEDPGVFVLGESPLELETRADSILESAETLAVARTVAKDYEEFAPPGVEIARLRVMDWTEEDRAEHAAVSDADIDEDAGIEVEDIDDEHAAQHDDTDQGERPDDGLDPAAGDATDPSLEFTLPPGELDRIFVEFRPMTPLAPPVPELHEAADPSEVAAGRARHQPPLRETADLEFVENEDPGSPHYAAWMCAAAAAALLLAAQVVHHDREWLVAHAPASVGALIRAAYGGLGLPLPAPANLSAYQLRQWGVAGDPNANGTLQLRASILNTSPQMQPYPLLRVTLNDRFGRSIGRREFEPAEYLGKPTARLLAPGERADATLSILDPGKNAEGFEIDVCLRAADRTVACASDAASQATR